MLPLSLSVLVESGNKLVLESLVSAWMRSVIVRTLFSLREEKLNIKADI